MDSCGKYHIGHIKSIYTPAASIIDVKNKNSLVGSARLRDTLTLGRAAISIIRGLCYSLKSNFLWVQDYLITCNTSNFII